MVNGKLLVCILQFMDQKIKAIYSQMENISLRKANTKDKKIIVDFDKNLDEVEHIKFNREQKILKAILNKSCFIIVANNKPVGFAIFDYRFFDLGWIELIVIEKKYRRKGIGGQAINLLCDQSTANKVFTSTNTSNIPMQRTLNKIGFSFSGKLDGLDDGDPELFYFKTTINNLASD